jgi:hypothetical protein
MKIAFEVPARQGKVGFSQGGGASSERRSCLSFMTSLARTNTMIDKSKITEHAEIVGSCGNHVGTVDHVDGDFIKLTRNDSSDGQHHYLPVSAIAHVEDGKVITTMNHKAALSLLQDQPETGAGGFAAI